MARAAAPRRLRSLRPAARRSGTQLSDAPREVSALRGAARQESGAARSQLRETAHGSLPTPRRSSRNRSEEHTSELQSRVDLVCRLLLEKKKKKRQRTEYSTQ